jgi:hypothetical protein
MSPFFTVIALNILLILTFSLIFIERV